MIIEERPALAVLKGVRACSRLQRTSKSEVSDGRLYTKMKSADRNSGPSLFNDSFSSHLPRSY